MVSLSRFIERAMRNLTLSIAALLALPVVIVGGFLGHDMWVEYAFARNTPLAANLGGEWGAMRDRFRERVQNRFPVGMPVTDVVTALVAQGFRPLRNGPPSGLMKPDDETARFKAMPMRPAMSVLEPNGACNIYWTVAWDLDANQRVTRTYGELDGYCL